MGLMEALGSGPVAIDASILIYFIERHPKHHALLRPLLAQARDGGRSLFTSALSLLEVEVAPLRARKYDLWRKYEQVLTRSREVHLTPIQFGDLRIAALLRAHFSVKTPRAPIGCRYSQLLCCVPDQ